MTNRVTVTNAQVTAARLVLKRAAARGLPLDPAVVKIAEARPWSAAAEASGSSGGPVVEVATRRTTHRSG